MFKSIWIVLAISALSIAADAKRIVLIADPALPPPAVYGLSELERSLRTKGVEVDRSSQLTGASTILAGLSTSRGAAVKALEAAGVPLPHDPESLVIRRTKAGLVLCGADARGLMYAALDVAERYPAVQEIAEKPYVAGRGVSIYTMQRRYFESRLYDEKHWERYFDLLARSRINNLVVIFGYENGGFLAPVYPYFFNTEGFPEVRFTNLTEQQQQHNVTAFHAMMRIAHERGIEVTAAIWDHIYRGGVQGGGIAGANETVGKALPWLVTGVTEQNLVPYTQASLRRFLEVFPELDALQFRMHDESGLKKEEMGSFWHDVFQMLHAYHPKVRLDLRAKDLPDSIIDDALAQGLQAQVSTKYWMEQMGMPFHPSHVNRQNQHDRRHGYADLLHYPQKYKVHWQLWTGGTARLLLWADPDYVRRFAASTRLYGGDSFDVNEMLATKMLGEPHDAEPRDILNSAYRYYDYEFERYWHFYQVWGRLTYNPDTSAALWEREFRQRMGDKAGVEAMLAMHLSSQILPRIVAAAYLYKNFPTTRGWAEMMSQGNLVQFAAMEGSDTEQFMSLRDRARSIVNRTDVAMRTPEATARWFGDLADRVLRHVDLAQQASGERASKELVSTLTDAKILAWLARYYSHRMKAGVSYCVFQENGDLASLDAAIAQEKQAIAAWEQIVASASDVYRDDLAFGVHRVGFPHHWKEELPGLRAGLQTLEEQRQTAPRTNARVPATTRTAGRTPPKVELLAAPQGQAKPGQDFQIAAKVTDPSGVKTVRLRYRHVTQYQDYATAEMLPDAGGVYRARIPGSFIVPEWNLMYFVEAIDRAGNGTIAPDLDVEAPYRMVSVVR